MSDKTALSPEGVSKVAKDINPKLGIVVSFKITEKIKYLIDKHDKVDTEMSRAVININLN